MKVDALAPLVEFHPFHLPEKRPVTHGNVMHSANFTNTHQKASFVTNAKNAKMMELFPLEQATSPAGWHLNLFKDPTHLSSKLPTIWSVTYKILGRLEKKLLTWEAAEKCQSKEHKGICCLHGKGSGCWPMSSLLLNCLVKPQWESLDHIYIGGQILRLDCDITFPRTIISCETSLLRGVSNSNDSIIIINFRRDRISLSHALDLVKVRNLQTDQVNFKYNQRSLIMGHSAGWLVKSKCLFRYLMILRPIFTGNSC